MEFTVLIWVAIAIFWVAKAVSEQKKRTQSPVRPPEESDERVAPRVESQAVSRNGRHKAKREAGRNERTDGVPHPYEVPSETIVRATAAALETRSETAGEAAPATAGPEHAAPTDGLLGEPFDLQRAVIYSEILKPKFEA